MFRSQIQNRVLYLVFADPNTRNSFSLRAADDLARLITQSSGQFDAVCFRAEGRVFCSGGNLADYGQMTDGSQGREVNRQITEVLNTVAALPITTFCLVEGDCFGGGVELLSAFDFVYAVPHAFFGLWQRCVGLTFGWGGGGRLLKRVGETQLKRLAISAETISAMRALEVGLIDNVSLDPLKRFEDAWSRMVKLPDAPVSGFKRWTPDTETAIFDEYWWSEGHRERLNARKNRNS